MSEFLDTIQIDVTASIMCCLCGCVDDAHGETEGGAVRNLDRSLVREGWKCYDGQAYCPRCLREKEAEEAQAAKPRRGRKKAT